MRIGICCMIKDTPKYLQELFVKHYLALGVSHINFVIDTGSKPVRFIDNPQVSYLQIEEALKEKTRWESMIRVPLYRKSRQIMMYNWFLTVYKDEYDWIAFVDDDEFIQMSLDILEEYKYSSALYMPWRLLARDSVRKTENLDGFKEVPVAYLINYIGVNRVKPFVNTHVCDHMDSDHFADYKGVFYAGLTYKDYIDKYKDKDYDIYICDNFPGKSKCYIDHYYIRSFEEYVNRIYDRGDNWKNHIDYLGVDIPNRNMCDYYACVYNDYCYVDELIKDLIVLDRFDIIRKILNDPVYYAVGCKIPIKFWNMCDKENLKQKYGEDKLNNYLKKYLVN